EPVTKRRAVTTRGEGPVDCQRLLDENVSERYLTGELTEAEQAAFEEHYFGCVLCFERLQVLEAARAAAGSAVEVGTRGQREATRPRRAAAVSWPLAAGIVFVTLA